MNNKDEFEMAFNSIDALIESFKLDILCNLCAPSERNTRHSRDHIITTALGDGKFHFIADIAVGDLSSIRGGTAVLETLVAECPLMLDGMEQVLS